MKKGAAFLAILVCFLGCACSEYKSSGNTAELAVSFVDPLWDGKTVPTSGQCRNCGGGGVSPALSIRNIPRGSDEVVVEFRDRTMGVFHGAIRYKILDQSEIVIPSIREETSDLPRGVEEESRHRAPVGGPGVYLAPCSCGGRNFYEATLLAVTAEPSGEKILLGKGKISLGEF